MENYEKQIWDQLVYSHGFSQEAAAGIMGNIHAESNCNPINLQNTANKRLNLTDEEYTKKVDSGMYTNFIGDSAGYGLCQWTYWSRKEALYNYAKTKNTSIGDLSMQVDFLVKELKSYGLYKTIKNSNDVYTVTKIFLTQFEKPASVDKKTKTAEQIEEVVKTRYRYSMNIYNAYADTLEKDLKTLLDNNIINSPEYWNKHIGDLKYLKDLVSNMANFCRQYS